jgi:hypothetical protein
MIRTSGDFHPEAPTTRLLTVGRMTVPHTGANSNTAQFNDASKKPSVFHSQDFQLEAVVAANLRIKPIPLYASQSCERSCTLGKLVPSVR